MNQTQSIQPTKDLAEEYMEYSNKMSAEKTYLLMSGEKYNLEEANKIINSLQDQTTFPCAIWAVSDNKIVDQIFLRTFSNERTRGQHKLNMLLHILPEYRGQGLASKLLKQGIEKAKEAGFKLILIQVFELNSVAIKLYEKFGFKTVGIVPNGYTYKDELVDERIMYLDLTQV